MVNYVLIGEIFHLQDWQQTGCSLQTHINLKFFGQYKHTAEDSQRQEIRIFNLHSRSLVWSSYLRIDNLDNTTLYAVHYKAGSLV